MTILHRLLTAAFFLRNIARDSDWLNSKPPHIIFILADDLGWDDVSYHGNKQVPTPNIDSLADSGIKLNNYYVQPVCTPTRAALMTGRYPIHTGMHEKVLYPAQAWGLGLNETLLPEYLKEFGYKTHAIGKWHLGFFAKEYTPTMRGFDSFYGFYSGSTNYFDHKTKSIYSGLDLHHNVQDNFHDVYNETGVYSTELFTRQAESLISKHDPEDPLFMYLSHQAVHTGTNPGEESSLQAPKDWIEKFSSIKHPWRRRYAAMVAYLDYSVGRVRKALSARGMLQNSIIIFSTDNGGPANNFGGNFASNYPLRGMKRTLWEGGVRGAAFIHSPLLNHASRKYNGLMHVTDWLPTLLSAVGADPKLLKNIDGVDQWDSLMNKKPSQRKEVLLNIRHAKMGKGFWSVRYQKSALRVGDWKLIEGQSLDRNRWYPPRGANRKKKTNSYTTVKCGKRPTKIYTCDIFQGPCLFNVRTDPCEYHDLSAKKPGYLKIMIKKLQKYKNSMVKSRHIDRIDKRSNPKRHGGVWKPWIVL